MTRPRLLLLLTLLTLCGAHSAFAFSELIEIPSHTLTEREFLSGAAQTGEAVTLSGRLSGPDTHEPLPAVILLHGTDGPGSGAVHAWTRFLNGIGIATLGLDSYSGRGIDQASTEQALFGQFTQIYDTYRAVEALTEDERIDGTRIAVMGFSRGGNGALYSALSRFQRWFGPERGRIVAHLPFYPACNFELLDDLAVEGAPIRLFHGADDDWTPAAPCRAYIDRLADAGHDAQMTEYPGALHAFDNTGSPSRFANPRWQTSRNCLRREQDGQLVNAETGQPFSYSDACVEYGPSVQYNDAAATAAQTAVAEFLAQVFASE